MLSRGYQLRNVAEGLAWRWWSPRTALIAGWLLSSAFFGLLHAGNPNATPTSTAFLMLAGLFLGLGFILTGELAIPIGLHITWNIFQGNVFGFPVSGTTVEASILAIEQRGPTLLTGGAFGPEGGISGLVALVFGSVAIWVWVRRTRGAAAPRGELAAYSRPERVRKVKPGR
jgi:membrane protease YdiL (CAAX protease family)